MTDNLMPAKGIYVIVPKHSGERVVSVIRDNGGKGATIVATRGSLALPFFALLAGMGEVENEIVFSIVPKCRVGEICDAIVKTADENPRRFAGVMGVLDVEGMYGGTLMSDAQEESEDMDSSSDKWNLITTIVNNGYADDVMAAARKAGSFGGTVVNGRGTARPDDLKFFGITIVPEKELLYILCPVEKTQQIVDAICSTKCVTTPGSGIVFVQKVSNVTYLGKRKD